MDWENDLMLHSASVRDLIMASNDMALIMFYIKFLSLTEGRAKFYHLLAVPGFSHVILAGNLMEQWRWIYLWLPTDFCGVGGHITGGSAHAISCIRGIAGTAIVNARKRGRARAIWASFAWIKGAWCDTTAITYVTGFLPEAIILPSAGSRLRHRCRFTMTVAGSAELPGSHHGRRNMKYTGQEAGNSGEKYEG